MQILIDDKEILKRIYGAPTNYITTGKTAVRYAIFNGDFVKFYFNYLAPKKFLYGQVRYDIFRKDYCINFNDFYMINDGNKCDNIYFKNLKYEVVGANRNHKAIVSLVIDKCFKFPIEYNNLLNKYLHDSHQYAECIKALDISQEEFHKKVIELHKEGEIEFDSYEVKDDPIKFSDPTLKFSIEYKCIGPELYNILTFNINRALKEIEKLIVQNYINPNHSIQGSTKLTGFNNIVAFFDYHAKPEHKVYITITNIDGSI